MKVSIPISLALLISVFFTACANTPARTVLEDRAAYGINAPSLDVGASGDVRYGPRESLRKLL